MSKQYVFMILSTISLCVRAAQPKPALPSLKTREQKEAYIAGLQQTHPQLVEYARKLLGIPEQGEEPSLDAQIHHAIQDEDPDPFGLEMPE